MNSTEPFPDKHIGNIASLSWSKESYFPKGNHVSSVLWHTSTRYQKKFNLVIESLNELKDYGLQFNSGLSFVKIDPQKKSIQIHGENNAALLQAVLGVAQDKKLGLYKNPNSLSGSMLFSLANTPTVFRAFFIEKLNQIFPNPTQEWEIEKSGLFAKASFGSGHSDKLDKMLQEGICGNIFHTEGKTTCQVLVNVDSFIKQVMENSRAI